MLKAGVTLSGLSPASLGLVSNVSGHYCFHIGSIAGSKFERDVKQPQLETGAKFERGLKFREAR